MFQRPPQLLLADGQRRRQVSGVVVRRNEAIRAAGAVRITPAPACENGAPGLQPEALQAPAAA